MGFIEIVSKSDVDIVTGMWKEFTEIRGKNMPESLGEVEGALVDGTRVVLGDDVMLALFSGEKMIDCATGPGAFVYHGSFANGEYSEDTAPMIAEIKAGRPEAFVMPGEEVTDVRLMYICKNGTVRVPFSFENVIYHDGRYNLDIELCGSGWVMIGPAAPLYCYALADYSKEKLKECVNPQVSEEDKTKLEADVKASFAKALAALKDADMDYDQIPFQTGRIAGLVNRELQKEWGRKQGIAVGSLEFAAIYPTEKSVQEMVLVRKTNRYVKREVPAEADGNAKHNRTVAGGQKENDAREDASEKKDWDDSLEDYIRENFGDEKVKAIKYYQQKMHTGLADAKAAIEKMLF